MDDKFNKQPSEGEIPVENENDEYNLANFKFFGQKDAPAEVPKKSPKRKPAKKQVKKSASAKKAPSEEIANEKESYSFDDYSFESIELQKQIRESLEDKKGKKGKKAKKEKKDTKGAKVRRTIAKILLSVFLIGVISACTIVGGVAVYLMNFMDNTIPYDLDQLKLNLTSVVYIKDSNGEWVEYQRVHGVENRIWVSLDKIPTRVQNAFIAIEDENFSTHSGVDWKRTIGALGNEIFGYWDNRQGGSTITQQLIKNLTGDKEQDAARKLREILRAIELEKTYSKDTILECYLNTIALGGSCYGVEVASEYYFGKTVENLTIAEAAIIAGISKNPKNNRPDTKFENAWKRAKTVLAKMYELGFITKEEYDAALTEEVVVVADKSVIKEKEINSYFVDTMITQVAEDLCAKYGYDYTDAINRIYNGGYKIYSTLDPRLQELLEKNANDPKYATFTSKKDGSIAQVGMCITDYSGHILATVGGRGEKDGNMLLDRSYIIAQQPGSGMKPLGAYALAIENNLVTFSSVMEDSPITKLNDDNEQDENGRDWPINFYQGYTGLQTIAHAIARSINTIPCKLVQQMGVTKCYDFVTGKLGLKHLNPGVNADASISALAIGGTNGGVTPVETCAAYAIFGNGGKYYEPKTYYKVTDQQGNLVLEVDQNNYTQAISEDSAWVMNGLLQNAVYGPNGTCWMLQNYSNMPAFGKSGTSTDYLDNWLTAGSPYYVATVWYGFDEKESCDGTYDHKYLLANLFKEIHEGLPYRNFEVSEDVIQEEYCLETGLLATDNCEHTAVGWYKKSYMPGICMLEEHTGKLLNGVVDITAPDYVDPFAPVDPETPDDGTGETPDIENQNPPDNQTE